VDCRVPQGCPSGCNHSSYPHLNVHSFAVSNCSYQHRDVNPVNSIDAICRIIGRETVIGYHAGHQLKIIPLELNCMQLDIVWLCPYNTSPSPCFLIGCPAPTLIRANYLSGKYSLMSFIESSINNPTHTGTDKYFSTVDIERGAFLVSFA
jgi:hypothetical protein